MQQAASRPLLQPGPQRCHTAVLRTKRSSMLAPLQAKQQQRQQFRHAPRRLPLPATAAASHRRRQCARMLLVRQGSTPEHEPHVAGPFGKTWTSRGSPRRGRCLRQSRQRLATQTQP